MLVAAMAEDQKQDRLAATSQTRAAGPIVEADLAITQCEQVWSMKSSAAADDVEQLNSSAPDFRARAVAVSDYFVDAQYEGEIVRARYRDGKFLLHKGGDRFVEIPGGHFGPEQISPTRDTRFVWMQSVIRCTHYVAGASEQNYINKADAPEVKFLSRDDISDSGKAYTELS